MKSTAAVLLALGLCLGIGAYAWPHYVTPRSDTQQLLADAAVPGRLWAYRVGFPFEELDSVALEIRRSSTPREHGFTVGSVSGDLFISHEDAEMLVSTGTVSSEQIGDGISVSIWLIELDKFLPVVPEGDQWRVAGCIEVPGVSSQLMPKNDFCRGGSISTSWARRPRWSKNEICVGRFRTHDRERIYDYYCVVVATDSEER